MQSAVEAKASTEDLRAIVREAWQREESHLSQLQRQIESKVTTSDLAALAALAEGKASMVDVESALQKQIPRRLSAILSEKQVLSKTDVETLLDSTIESRVATLSECHRRVDEVARKQHRMSLAVDELKTEVHDFGNVKIERAEVEAIVSGALADWMRAAKHGANAVQAALTRKHPSTSFSSAASAGNASHISAWAVLPEHHTASVQEGHILDVGTQGASPFSCGLSGCHSPASPAVHPSTSASTLAPSFIEETIGRQQVAASQSVDQGCATSSKPHVEHSQGSRSQRQFRPDSPQRESRQDAATRPGAGLWTMSNAQSAAMASMGQFSRRPLGSVGAHTKIPGSHTALRSAVRSRGPSVDRASHA